MSEAYDIARLRWACRRGMLELDLIFEPYANTRYPTASRSEQALFWDLLSCNDQELFDWLLKKQAPRDVKFQAIIDILLAHAKL